MARRQQQPQEIEVDLPFPLEGLDNTRAFLKQRPGTTAGALNVRAFDPLTDRARGGQRRGLSRYYPASDTTVSNGFALQDINHLVTNTVSNSASIIGQFVYAFTAANHGAGVALQTTSSGTVTAASTMAFACSCWDGANNVYIGFVNTSTGATAIYSFSWINPGSGPVQFVQRWGPISVGTITASIRAMAGMCVIGNNLYVATRQSSPLGAVHILQTASGTQIGLNWLNTTLTSNYANLIFSTNSINCLAACGNLLGIVCYGASTKQGLMIVDTTQIPSVATPVYYSFGGTQSATRSTLVSDGYGIFYAIAPVTTSCVQAVSSSGLLIWASTAADTPNGLCFDNGTGTLMTVNSSGNSMRSLNLQNGTLISAQSGSPDSITHWDWIDSDGTGNFTIWRDSQATNNIMGTNTTQQTIWGPTNFTSSGSTTLSGGAMNKGVVNVPSLAGSRIIVGLLVANGEVRTFTTAGTTSLTNGKSLQGTSQQPVIFSAQNGVRMFYADGKGYFYVQSNAVVAWTASSGSMPYDSGQHGCRLIETWRGRSVMSGLQLDGQNWFMSAANNSFDFNYNPITPSSTQAVSGDDADIGKPGDIVYGIIPYNNDTLIFLCSESIWQMTGDPANGGSLDVISHQLGGAWGRAWAIDPMGQIYFWGNRSGIWKMTPGALPVRISQQIERLTQNVDLSANIIRMAWDIWNQGLAVWITPIAGGATTNYFWEERVNAWWQDVYANTAHNPLAVHVYESDTPQDRVIMIGGRDGQLYYLNNTATMDDQTAISSSILLGPIMTPMLDEVMFKVCQATLALGSGTVTYSVLVGRSAEDALASTPVVTGTWNASSQGGRNPTAQIRRAGIACYLKLSASNYWALEKIRLVFQPLGPVRRRLA